MRTPEARETVREDRGVGLAPWRATTYSLYVLGAMLVLCYVASWASRAFSTIGERLLVVILTLALAFALGRWLWKWMYITVIYKLDGSTLVINKTHDGKKPLRGFPKKYNLADLWAAEVVSETRIRGEGTVTLYPKKLVLLFDSSGGTAANQAKLSRPRVSGPAKEENKLLEQLETWNEICDRIEALVLPDALVPRWQWASPYQRYRLLILQAELTFLKGPSTPLQMCLVSLGVFGSMRRVGEIAMGAWTAFAVFGTLIGVALFLSLGLRWLFRTDFGLEDFFSDPNGQLKPVIYLPLSLSAFAGAAVVLVSMFSPLSQRLQQQEKLRRAQADRLHRVGAKYKDLDPILKFVKDDQDRVSFDYQRMTLISAAGTIVGTFLKDPTVSLTVTAAAGSILVLTQLWYAAQIQILRLAQTACLIAQSELPATE